MVTAEFLPTGSFKIAGHKGTTALPSPSPAAAPGCYSVVGTSHGAKSLGPSFPVAPSLPTSVHLPTLASRQPPTLPTLSTLPYPGGATLEPRWVPDAVRASVGTLGVEHEHEHDQVKITAVTPDEMTLAATGTQQPPSMISSTATFPRLCDSRHYCSISFCIGYPSLMALFGWGGGGIRPVSQFLSRPGPVRFPNHPMRISCHPSNPVTHTHRSTHITLMSTSTRRHPGRWRQARSGPGSCSTGPPTPSGPHHRLAAPCRCGWNG